MRIDILIASITLALFAVACDSRHQTDSGSSSVVTNSTPRQTPLPPQFAFIETNLDSITLEEVTNRIGPFSRVGHLGPDSPVLAYEFDLPDHSALLVILDRPFQARNRVHRAQFFLSTNDFRLFP
jgi:hypothetical protein